MSKGTLTVSITEVHDALRDAVGAHTRFPDAVVVSVLREIGVEITWPITQERFDEGLPVVSGVPIFEVGQGDTGTLISYGHCDRDAYALAVTARDLERDPIDEPVRAEAVLLTYAVTTRDPADPDGPWFRWGVAQDTPHAFPATVIVR